MRIANHDGRLVLAQDERFIDVEKASAGRFSSDTAAIYSTWAEFTEWAGTQSFAGAADLDPSKLGAPSPRPVQTFGIGTNYRRHVEEVGWPVPEVPLVFTKWPSSVTGPGAVVELSGPRVDWEVEVVVVIGRAARRVSAADAWSHVAGLTVGQDISDRDTQNRPETYPQFGLGKSHPGYSPIGPVLVTPDEFDDPDDIELGCLLNGQEVQKSSTSDLIFSVPQLIEYLSGILTLLPGDLIFTGTPSGVGTLMDPPRYLTSSDEITSWATRIGTMSHTFTAGPEVRG
ncbi:MULTISPECIES: fumarylacetoacetate hydrolase family protein [unclassified Streptomyces]|uniref:fumarylacetoacetate hydrolase family protein n=1 Tax=unclassified Streptomyces TaxID=2593676 RepID=UPI00225A1A60|nr:MULTISPECIES: fumarylacetoacetate hydrolase family protein [unclassified Streptomyces]MCX4406046.1 fumarylacetoacetate hydrolase family protein [Streptomyces sp. NBC_01764]MCX5189430.1 fumarylacetoacetate hydrolase family protein [Streptomyces sp. NBC_00268]